MRGHRGRRGGTLLLRCRLLRGLLRRRRCRVLLVTLGLLALGMTLRLLAGGRSGLLALLLVALADLGVGATRLGLVRRHDHRLSRSTRAWRPL
ncbi:hypothetical protein GCM10027425_14050 [Alteromonas gracilis]